MELIPQDLDTWLRTTSELAGSLDRGDAGPAFAHYLETWAQTSSRGFWEWQLAWAIPGGSLPVERPVAAPMAWPEGFLDRPTGAALAFVACQYSGFDPPAVAALPALVPHLPDRWLPLLAQAWQHRPEGVATGNVRRSLAHCLAQDSTAIGHVLIALVAGGDAEDLAALSRYWLERGLRHPGAPAQVATAAALPALRGVAHQALLRCYVRARQPAALLTLLRAALALEDWRVALALTRQLLDLPIPDAERRETLASRLWALAESGRLDELRDEYRQSWMPSGWFYPHPERLLYTFHQIGDPALERHLAAHANLPAEAPEWVRLSCATAVSGEIDRPLLEAWAALYQRQPRDERVLVGVTRTILRAPVFVRQEWIDRLRLTARWRSLLEVAAYRGLAAASLVQLAASDEDRIETFETLLPGVQVDTPYLRQACRAYVAALRRLRRWDRLEALHADQPAILAACPFLERELARCMAEVSQARSTAADSQGARTWCSRWEHLVSLPLATPELIEVLDHYLRLRPEVDRLGTLESEPERLEDLHLQLLRRGKAEAEALWLHHPGGQDAVAAANRLHPASLAATVQIIQELSLPSAQAEGSKP